MAGFLPPDESVLDRLKAIVGAGGWREPRDAARYFDDPRGRFEGRACLVLLPASTEEVARIVRLCNATEYGLAAYAYTRDLGRAFRLNDGLDYGLIGINAGLITTVEAPFGGLKESGLGKEGGSQGLDDYLETKYVCVAGLNS